MDSYSDLFEKMNEQETPEDTLQIMIAQEITQLTDAVKGDFWENYFTSRREIYI